MYTVFEGFSGHFVAAAVADGVDPGRLRARLAYTIPLEAAPQEVVPRGAWIAHTTLSKRILADINTASVRGSLLLLQRVIKLLLRSVVLFLSIESDLYSYRVVTTDYSVAAENVRLSASGATCIL